MSEAVRISILGATGYGGGELLRLAMASGGQFEVVHATSRTEDGVPVSSVHRNLYGRTDLAFSNPSTEEIGEASDVIIGALPHGASAEALAPFVDQGMKVVDLSGDFRLRDPLAYRRWYGREHPRPDLLKEAVYGCTECNGERIKSARLVASPGCFATAINLALLPAASAKAIKGTPTVAAMTGSSGSGATPKAGTHHPTRAETLRPYKTLRHQHTPEVVQLAGDVGSELEGLSIIPVSVPIVRGILAAVSVELKKPLTEAEAMGVYTSYYGGGCPFVKVLTDREPECASVAGTNFVEVRPHVGEDGRLHVLCTIDNLVKGGAGQGFECLMLMCGLDPAAPTSPLSWPGMWP